MSSAPPALVGALTLAEAEEVPLAERELPGSTYDLLLRAAATWPDEVASTWLADPRRPEVVRTLTHAETAVAVTRLANALVRLGVRRGDAVTLCSPNVSVFQYHAGPASSYLEICCTVSPGDWLNISGSWITGVSGPSDWVRSTTLMRPLRISSTSRDSTVTLDMGGSLGGRVLGFGVVG